MNRNPNASLLFNWPEHSRQIRIEGVVKKISQADSDRIFVKQPKVFKLLAYAPKQQSQVIDDLQSFDDSIKTLDTKIDEKITPRPDHWGGYCLNPTMIEFYQSNVTVTWPISRIRYSMSEDQIWTVDNMVP